MHYQIDYINRLKLKIIKNHLLIIYFITLLISIIAAPILTNKHALGEIRH
jgi:hypothetical protein